MQNQRQVCVADVATFFFDITGTTPALLMLALYPCPWQQDMPLFSSDGPMFYTIMPAKQGASGEFHHIANLSAQVSLHAIYFHLHNS